MHENLIQCTNGQWIHCEAGILPGTFNILLDENVCVTVNVNAKNVQLLCKDESGCFCYFGDMTFSAVPGALDMMLFSPALPEPELSVTMTVEQRERYFG